MGGRYSIILTILLFSIIFNPVIESHNNKIYTLQPGPPMVIYGEAVLENGSIPIKAQIIVTNSFNQTHSSYVKKSGFWQVHVDYTIGTQYLVKITFEDSWIGCTKAVINDSTNNVGEIILYKTNSNMATIAGYESGNYLPFDQVQFFSQVCGGKFPFTYIWDFGDGSTSTEQHPTHSYEEPGLYNVILTAKDESNNSDNDSLLIKIKPFLIDVEYQEKVYLIGEQVHFDILIIGGESPFQYYWDFGDNTYSVEQNPIKSYEEPGYYDIDFTVKDASNNTNNKSLEIKVEPFFLEIEYLDKNYVAGEIIKFNSTIIGINTPFQYRWNFGDGEYSNNQSPSHRYSNGGTYTIKLNVTDSEGYSKSTKISIFIQRKPELNILLFGVEHKVIYHHGSISKKFPLGRIILFNNWVDVFYNPVFAPLYYQNIKDNNPNRKIVTYTAYNRNGNEIFHKVYYEEFTIIISPFRTVYGPGYFPFAGKAVVYGS